MTHEGMWRTYSNPDPHGVKLLMYQMHLSTTYVFSVILRQKRIGNPNVMAVKPEKSQQCSMK
jgi:hypothetical protein